LLSKKDRILVFAEITNLGVIAAIRAVSHDKAFIVQALQHFVNIAGAYIVVAHNNLFELPGFVLCTPFVVCQAPETRE
jgi:DNA polymerase III alpha subunit (gram-positive type)